jgi:hypothetical protein
MDDVDVTNDIRAVVVEILSSIRESTRYGQSPSSATAFRGCLHKAEPD